MVNFDKTVFGLYKATRLSIKASKYYHCLNKSNFGQGFGAILLQKHLQNSFCKSFHSSAVHKASAAYRTSYSSQTHGQCGSTKPNKLMSYGADKVTNECLTLQQNYSYSIKTVEIPNGTLLLYSSCKTNKLIYLYNSP